MYTRLPAWSRVIASQIKSRMFVKFAETICSLISGLFGCRKVTCGVEPLLSLSTLFKRSKDEDYSRRTDLPSRSENNSSHVYLSCDLKAE